MFTVPEEDTKEVWPSLNAHAEDEKHEANIEGFSVKGKTSVPKKKRSQEYTNGVTNLQLGNTKFSDRKTHSKNYEEE